MATKLYLHDAAFVTSGTAPSTIQAVTTEWQVSGYTTCRTMNTTIGTAQTSRAGNSLAQTAAQQGFLGFFVSPPLDVDQTVGDVSETLTLNIASAESDLAMNLTDLRCELYVWRPSTGAVVGTMHNYSLLTGDAEPGAASSERVNQGTSTAVNPVNALAGDVIVLEVLYNHSQANATSRTCTFYYDGTTETTTTNTVVSDHASFLNLSLTTATFEQPSFDMDATAAATFGGRSTAASAADQDATASLTWNGASRIASSFDQDAAASVTWVGQASILAAAAFDMDAAASVTWGSRTFIGAPFSSVAVALQRWNGATINASALDSDAAADQRWNGASRIAAALNVDARAVLTWNGRSTVAAACDIDAVASLTWNGEEVVDVDAAAAWSSTATATASWNGASSSAADLTSTAVASVSWNGTGIFPGAVSIDAAASLTWTGVTLANASWESNAVSAQNWNGSATVSAAYQSTALAVLTWNGTATAESAWRADTLGVLEWEGVGEGTPTTENGSFQIVTTALAQFTAEVIAEAAFDLDAVSSVTWDWDVPKAPPRIIDGRRLSRLEDSDEEDIMLFMAAINTYLEQDHDDY